MRAALGLVGDGAAGAAPSSPAAAEVARAAALVLLYLGRGPAQAGADLVGDDLDLGATFALLVLPGALLEAAGDDHPSPLLQRFARVLGHVPPTDDVEERHRLLALVGLPVVPDPVDGEPERGRGLTARGEPQLGVAGDVADQ